MKPSKSSKHEVSGTPAQDSYARRGPPTISPPTTVGADSFPYCQRALQLLEELSKSDWLPVYNEDAIRAVVEECSVLKDAFEEIVAKENRDEARVRATLQILQECIYRNKRCVLVYLRHRTNKLEELWWKTASPSLSAEIASKLSPAEIDYYSKFQELVSKTMDNIDLDLTGHVQPPHDLLVEVRALKDAGELLLQSGARVILEKNSTHFLRRTDVEHLIRQDYLEQVN